MMDYSAGFCYYVHDHLYSPAVLLGWDGTILERYEYDAYGNCSILEPNFAPDPDGKSDYGNPYLFTGRDMDVFDNDSLKVYNYRMRVFDPYTGRFLQHDPLGYVDGMNVYEYIKSNPMIYKDPLGLICGECYPPAPGFPNAYYPRIVKYGTSSGVVNPSTIKGLREGVVLLDAAGGLSTIAKFAAMWGISFSAAIEKLIQDGLITVDQSLLTQAALNGVDWIQQNISSSGLRWGFYLWAYVEYKECVECWNWCRPWTWGARGCKLYKWETKGKWHACKANTFDYSIPKEDDSQYTRSDAFQDAIEFCKRSAMNNPADPPRFGPAIVIEPLF